MTRVRGSLATSAGIALVAALTTWVAMLSWRGFSVVSDDYLAPLLVLGVVVAGSGVALRWWRVPGPAVFLVQLVLGLMTASALLVGSPLPVGDAGRELVALFEDALASSRKYAAPIPREAPSIAPLLVAGGLACLLLVDLFAGTLRRVPLAGLPLLAVYSVPVSMLGTGLAWWIFVLTAAGFMTMLFLQENEALSRWGRPLGEDPTVADPQAFGVRTGAIRASAGTIGGVATALAVALPLAIPTLSLEVFDFGRGPGGEGEIELENPMADLRRDLIRGEDVPLVQVRTQQRNPGYLRIAVLNRFTGNEWSSGDRVIPPEQRPTGEMPSLVGVDDSVQRRLVDYQVQVSENFRSTWLPTQAPITRIDAPGDWRFDRSTMDFLRGDQELDTAGLSYTMTTAELELDAVAMSRAGSSSGLVSRELLELPPGLPSLVRNLANEVTVNAPTRYEKAVALQTWFREVGGFEYSLESVEGNGTDELVTFLQDKVGYCEQYAATMAVMARLIGIPARVAVGFLRPDRLGPNTYEYSAHDLHSWPELFFEGAGWVRFEPTPADRAAGVPGYTTEVVPDVPDPAVPSGPRTDILDQPSASTSAPSAEEEQQGDEAGAGSSGSFPWTALVVTVLVSALLLLLVALPRLVRRAQRERRLAGGPEEAWAELEATARDLRIPWPVARSPRETRAVLVEFFGPAPDEFRVERPLTGPEQAPDAVVAVDRIVRSLEMLRYSRDADASGTLRAEVDTCVAALENGAVPRARRAARWWPRSVFVRPTPVRRSVRSEPEGDRQGGVVEHVG